MPLALQVLIAAVAGALSTLAHVHTEAWWLGLLAAAALARIVWGLRPGPAALAGWAFGTAWVTAATWWLYISMHHYGGMPAPLAAAAVLALASALAAYWALAMAAVARARSGLARWDIPAFAGAWLVAELARGQWFTGFPWAASGYAQVDGPLAAWAPWVGVYGIGWWVAALGAALAWPWRAGGAARWWPPVAAVALLAASAGLPQRFTTGTGVMTVSLLQTGVAQDEKFDRARLDGLLQALMEDLQQARGQLVVAPETAVPVLPQDLDPAAWAALAAPFTASGGERAALVGLPLTRGDAGYTNSVAAWLGAPAPAGSPRYRYDKHHLVPFGEFIPMGFRWFVDLMHIPLGDFDRGEVVQASLPFAGQRIAPNICYEDLFGEELARRLHDPTGAPTILANVSNIAWFGPTMAVTQHLHISRMRSLELQRPMLRATNTGATAVIDHRGRVTAWLEPQVRGVLEARVEGRQGVTPYARWAGTVGLWPLWGLGVAVLALALALQGAAPARPRFGVGSTGPRT